MAKKNTTNNKNDNKDNLTKRSRRRWISRIIIIAILVALFFGIWHIFTPDQENKVLRAAQSSKQTLTEKLNFTGTVAPSKIQEVENLDIPIKEIKVEAGDHVKKGEQLLTYDISPLEDDLAELEEQREEAIKLIEESKEEVAQLLEEGLPTGDLAEKLQYMSGDLSAGLSDVANGMLSIGYPLQQLMNELDYGELNDLMSLLQQLSDQGEKFLSLIEDFDLRNQIEQIIAELKQRIEELEDEIEAIHESIREKFPSLTLPKPSLPSSFTFTATWPEFPTITWPEYPTGTFPTYTLPTQPSETFDPGPSSTASSEPTSTSSSLPSDTSTATSTATTSSTSTSNIGTESSTSTQSTTTTSVDSSGTVEDPSPGDIANYNSEGEVEEQLAVAADSPVLTDEYDNLLCIVDNEHKGDTFGLVPLANSGQEMDEATMLLLMQLQSAPGGQDLLSGYQQGADLIRFLEQQIEQQKELIDKAKKHEVAEFDGLVAEVQRDLEELDPQKAILIIYDERKPIVHSRVNRKDALRLEKGQEVQYTTDNLRLVGKIIFKSPIATTTPVNSSGESSSLMSSLLSGASDALMPSEARVDIEASVEGHDLQKIIFGFDIAYEVSLDEKENALAVPAESLLAEQNEYYVYVLKDNNTVELRNIELGIITQEYAEIISGLEKNEWVILNPPGSLEEGTRYDVTRED